MTTLWMRSAPATTGKLELIEQAARPVRASSTAWVEQQDSRRQKLEVTDIYKTSGCPLARVMRYELRKRRILAQGRVLKGASC